MSEKPKLAMYWASSCGGCEISTLNIHEHILDVDAVFDIAFFPCIADFKVHDVKGYPDGYIDVCLFNGAIRTSENEEMAHLLRQKSKVMVAFGSCAYEGCIPALSNLTTKEATFNTVYFDNPTIDNPDRILPQPISQVPEGELTIPVFYHTVKSLDQVVDVDYTIPGCPPEPHQIWAVLEAVVAALTQGAALPPSGIVGAGNVAVCEECSRTRDVKKIKRFYRPYEVQPDPDICLLEQGIMCLGIATRSGCGALCPQVGMGCQGCYGAVPGVEDQGAKMVTAIASVMDVGKPGELDEATLEKEINAIFDSIPDPAGTFYRFSMAHSILRRTRFNGRMPGGNGHGEG